MNHGLLRKELRDLRPFAWLGFALVVVEILEMLLKQWDMQSLAKGFYGLDGFHVFQFLFAFAVGSGLLTREIDGGTLAFLDGLPVTRARSFLEKLVAALLVLLVYPVGYTLLHTALHLKARGTLDHDVHVTLLLLQFGKIGLLTIVALCIGMLLGFLRSLCWMLLALLSISAQLLSEAWPRFSALNPVESVGRSIVDTQHRLPVTTLAVQFGLALAFAASAWWAFRAAGAGRGRRLQVQLSRPVVSALVTLATIAALIGAFAVAVKSSVEQRPPRVDANSVNGAQFSAAAPGHAQTVHYTFSYPAGSSEPVQALLLHADEIFAKVASELRIEGGAAIDVDLSGSIDNTEGTAYFDRVRMSLSAEAPLLVLAHETTHVFAIRLAGGEHERALGPMQAFNEGLARWVEQKLKSGDGVSDRDRLQAALVSHRHMLVARQLIDMDALARDMDLNLQYPLGAILVDVLVRRYGAEAPAKILRTLGHPDFPRDLSNLSLWQAAFQLSGFDLGLVFDDYALRVNAWEGEFASSIAALPRPRGSLVRDGKWVGVAVRLDSALPEGWSTVVRFRPREDSPLREYVTRWTDKDRAWLAINQVADEKVCFQSGVGSNDIVIYEAWTCLPLESAEETSDE